MTSYEFSLRLNRQITDEEAEALYEAGCDDAGIETGPYGTLLDFDREGTSLAEAIADAARDIEKVPGLRAVGVKCDSMVTLLDIAARTRVARETVRLWATGARGPGGFPSPVLTTRGGERVWEWEQVATWLREYRHRPAAFSFAGAAAEARLRVLSTANHVLAARDALMSEPDDSVREEFERLLEDA
jgi:hypothetical protein